MLVIVVFRGDPALLFFFKRRPLMGASLGFRVSTGDPASFFFS